MKRPARGSNRVRVHSPWTEAAFSQLKEACQLDKKNGEAAFNYAIVCLALPKPKVDEARKYYELSVSLGMVRDPELDKYFKQFDK